MMPFENYPPTSEPLEEQESRVMRTARKAAEKVATWSPEKQDFARRISGPPAPAQSAAPGQGESTVRENRTVEIASLLMRHWSDWPEEVVNAGSEHLSSASYAEAAACFDAMIRVIAARLPAISKIETTQPSPSPAPNSEGLVAELRDWADRLQRVDIDSPGARTLREAALALERAEREVEIVKAGWGDDQRLRIHMMEKAQATIAGLVSALEEAKKLLEAERDSLVDGYTILYKPDPNYGELSAEGREQVEPFNRCLRKIAAALYATKGER
jgi:hypothetical protein